MKTHIFITGDENNELPMKILEKLLQDMCDKGA